MKKRHERMAGLEGGEVSIRELLHIAYLGRFIIIALAVIGLFSGWAYDYLTYETMYAAQASMVVNSKRIDDADGSVDRENNISMSQELAETYRVVIKSERTMDIVAERLGMQGLEKDIRDSVRINATDGTEVLFLLVLWPDGNQAIEIANAVLDAAPEVLADTVGEGTVKVIDYAEPPLGIMRQNKKRYILYGGLLGLAAGFFLVVARGLLFAKASGSRSLGAELGLEVLGEIPRHGAFLSPVRGSIENAKGQNGSFVDAFRRLAMKIMNDSGDAGAKSILVTSTLPEEGKSTICVYLAMALEELGKRVLVADMDCFRPGIRQMLEVGERGREEGIVAVAGTGVDWVFARKLSEGGDEVSNMDAAWSLAEKAAHGYDYVILDGPPAAEEHSVIRLGLMADGIIYVARQGHVALTEAAGAVERIGRFKVSFSGCVLNCMDHLYEKGRYGYHYGDEG